MSTITLYKTPSLPTVREIARKLHGKRCKDRWFTAMASKFNQNEVYANFWYYEDIEEGVKKMLSNGDAGGVVSILKQNGRTKIMRRIYCFINTLTKTLEIYRGPDSRTDKIMCDIENILDLKFERVSLNPEQLQNMYSQHGVELTQVMFKNIHGLIYDIFRGKYLENNSKYQQYLHKFSDSLCVVSFRPKIKFLNGNNKYQITINGDKGTVRLSSNGKVAWRPRFEVRQIMLMISATAGFLPS